MSKYIGLSLLFFFALVVSFVALETPLGAQAYDFASNDLFALVERLSDFSFRFAPEM